MVLSTTPSVSLQLDSWDTRSALILFGSICKDRKLYSSIWRQFSRIRTCRVSCESNRIIWFNLFKVWKICSDFIEKKKTQKPINEQLDEINSALSKLGYKAPNDEQHSQIENPSSEMENLQKLQDFSKAMIGAFGKLQNLLPNEMQNKFAASFEKLEHLKQTTNQTDDFLKPHNDMEGWNDLFSEALKPGIGGQKRSFFRLHFSDSGTDNSHNLKRGSFGKCFRLSLSILSANGKIS